MTLKELVAEISRGLQEFSRGVGEPSNQDIHTLCLPGPGHERVLNEMGWFSFGLP